MKETIRRISAAGTGARVLCALLALGALVPLGSTLGGCGGGSSTTNTPSTTRLIASWRLVRTSGGLTGNGYPVTPDGETLTFKSNGTFTRRASGQTTSGTYQVTQRKTFLSDAELPVISYSTVALPDVISELDSQRLVTSEEAADGFNREYERVTP